MKIVEQKLLKGGILTTYENGEIDMLPYKVDENGDEYAELFPNPHKREEKL